jgi:hypothetical protein
MCSFCAELWYMPAPTSLLSVALTSNVYASLLSLDGSARAGAQNLTLGRSASFSQDLVFQIQAENGTLSPSFTVRVVQAAPRSNASFTLQVQVGSFGATLTRLSNASAFAIRLPATAANSIASLQFFVAVGALLAPSNFAPTLLLGARGFSSAYPFSITTEVGAVSYNLTITVSQLTQNNWTATVKGGSILSTLALSSATAPPLTVVTVDSGLVQPIALDSSTFTYWTAGDNCATNPNTLGSVGSLGVASDNNLPRARQGFVSWVGLDSHLYLYGSFVDLAVVVLTLALTLHKLMWPHSLVRALCRRNRRIRHEFVRGHVEVSP